MTLVGVFLVVCFFIAMCLTSDDVPSDIQAICLFVFFYFIFQFCSGCSGPELDLQDKCDYDRIEQELICWPRTLDHDLDNTLSDDDREQLNGKRIKKK